MDCCVSNKVINSYRPIAVQYRAFFVTCKRAVFSDKVIISAVFWGRRRFGIGTGAKRSLNSCEAMAVTLDAATSQLEKASERQHEVSCLIAVKNQKLETLKAECNDKVDDGQTPRTNPR